MAGRAEFLYASLTDRNAIDVLIGEPEDGHLDCKEWPAKEKRRPRDVREGYMRARELGWGRPHPKACGLNRRRPNDPDPDVITAAVPVLGIPACFNPACSRSPASWWSHPS